LFGGTRVPQGTGAAKLDEAPVGYAEFTRDPEAERLLERVVAAGSVLKARRVAITRGNWGIVTDGRHWSLALGASGCCGVGALALVERVESRRYPLTGISNSVTMQSVRADVARHVGIDATKLDAFIHGFDGNPWPSQACGSRHEAFYEAGKAAWERLAATSAT
jgi:hypothetical protein